MAGTKKSKGKLVTGVIGEDVHIVGIRILEHALRNAGFEIIALGAQTPQDDFIKAAKENKADAILVSSLSGHANVLVQGMRERCAQAGIKDIVLYIGGQLVIGETPWPEVDKLYKGMGFNRVYSSDVDVNQVIKDLEADLK